MAKRVDSLARSGVESRSKLKRDPVQQSGSKFWPWSLVAAKLMQILPGGFSSCHLHENNLQFESGINMLQRNFLWTLQWCGQSNCSVRCETTWRLQAKSGFTHICSYGSNVELIGSFPFGVEEQQHLQKFAIGTEHTAVADEPIFWCWSPPGRTGSKEWRRGWGLCRHSFKTTLQILVPYWATDFGFWQRESLSFGVSSKIPPVFVYRRKIFRCFWVALNVQPVLKTWNVLVFLLWSWSQGVDRRANVLQHTYTLCLSVLFSLGGVSLAGWVR